MATDQTLAKLSKKDLRNALSTGTLREFLKLPNGSEIFEDYLNTQGDNKKYWDCWILMKEVLSLKIPKINVAEDTKDNDKLLECVRKCYEVHFDVVQAEKQNMIDLLSTDESTKIEDFLRQGDLNQRDDVCSIFKRHEQKIFEQLDENIFRKHFLAVLVEHKKGKEKDADKDKQEKQRAKVCNAL